MKKILFICLGNICRSPMAEYLFRNIAKQYNLIIETASSGTSGWHNGEFMHCGTAEILDNLHIDTQGFQSSQLKDSDFDYYDYLIVMDDNNLRDVHARFGKSHKIFKITDLCPHNGYNHIPDPWYTGNFNETRDLLTECCHALANQLTSGKL